MNCGECDENFACAQDGVPCIRLAAQPAPAAPAVREPLHAWEFVAMWATAAEKHGDTYDVAVEFGRAVEARHGIGTQGGGNE